MSLWELSVRRPVLATVLSLFLVVFGLIGWSRLSVRELPDVEFPVVSVLTVLPGGSPEVVEKEVTEILEEAVNTVEGIRVLSSSSSDEVSQISIEFELDRGIDAAVQDVRDRVAGVRGELPEEVEEPVVAKNDLDDRAIVWMSLNSDSASLQEISDHAEDVLKERFQRLPGVGRVLLGGRKRFALRVRVDADKLAGHGLAISDVLRALARENVEIPAGRIEGPQREFVVQTEGSLSSLEAFRRLRVLDRGGRVVRLAEVAKVEAGDEGDRNLARFNLHPHVSIGIVKQSRANTVAVAQAVRAEMVRARPDLPPGYRLEPSFDSAVFVEESIAEVEEALLLAVVLVVAVIWLFLHGFRSALIPALAIPVSVLTTFGVLELLGFSINTLTLLGLALSVGVVVDDAIIVLENVYRHVQAGQSPFRAAIEGTGEIAFAAIAATLSLVVVFLPVAFVSGVVGRFFVEFGVTIVVAVVASGFVALTLTPMLCSRLLQREGEPRGLARAFESGLGRLTEAYRRGLERALDAPRGTVIGAFVVLAVTVALALLLGREFVPSEDRGGFMVMLESPEGSTIEHHDRLQWQIEKVLADIPEVRTATAFIGLSAAGRGAVNRGVIFVRLVDRAQRTRSQDELIAEFRARSGEVPGILAFATPFSGLPIGGRGKPLQFVVQSADFKALRDHSGRLLEAMRGIAGIVGADSDLRIAKPELAVRIDRDRAAEQGVDASEIGEALRAMLGGVAATRYRSGNHRYDVIVQLEDEDREVPDQILALQVRGEGGRLVSLGNLVEVTEEIGPSAVNHYNRRRSVVLDANLVDLPLGEALAEVRRLAREILPAGFTTEVAGESAEFEDVFQSLGFAFLLAVVALYLVLAAQFESFVDPFTVLLALPLAVFGAFLLLAVFGMTLNIYSLVGCILLAGLVTKNSILLVDRANRLIAGGAEVRAALIDAGTTRLRPILMTALSTVLGILPVAVGLGAGAESRRPLGVVVAGGVTTSTVLTLFVVPVFYQFLRRRNRSEPTAEIVRAD